ncbi:helix-turn-helix domain-containing protein [Gordonia sp. HS-NH1]|uniref:helix-turn-helix domain-containing protein n=1 Tax=Gordonia sp. HS-NH1 TaxID=1435068 RepID=UPI0009FD0F88|nr:helix-turn-helix domain-containing protein [Gordonia sp. HS-NH1]
MTDFWTTTELGAADQVGYWADVLCQAFTPLAPSRSRDHMERSRVSTGLPGWVRSLPIGTSNAAEIASCTQRVDHGEREVSRTADDVIFVNLQIDGQCLTEQDGRRCVVGRGEFAIVDSTRPYSLEFVEPEDSSQLWRVLSFRLPRESVADLVADPSRAATATTFTGDGGSANIARTLMTSTWQSAGSVENAAELQMLGAAHTAVIRAVLAGARQSPTPDSSHVDNAARHAAAVHYIDTHLPLGPVSAAGTARAINVSVRTLHKVFERSGTTFGAAVRQRRLHACSHDLLSGDHRRPIGELAARWGYADSAHMAKAFRAHFGCTPGQYRQERSPQFRASTVSTTTDLTD